MYDRIDYAIRKTNDAALIAKWDSLREEVKGEFRILAGPEVTIQILQDSIRREVENQRLLNGEAVIERRRPKPTWIDRLKGWFSR